MKDDIHSLFSQSFIIRNSVKCIYTLYAMRVSWSKDRHTLDTSSDNRLSDNIGLSNIFLSMGLLQF
jgi:hypothetical protein